MALQWHLIWIYCGMQTMLISGGNDGTLSLWNVDGPQATKELTPKLSVKVVCFCTQSLQIDLILPTIDAKVLMSLAPPGLRAHHQDR